jgi:hypothetical protein
MQCNVELAANVTSHRPQLSKALSSITTRDAGKVRGSSAGQRRKAEDLILSTPSSKLKATREETESKELSPISRTVEGITTLVGSLKQHTTFSNRMKREPVVEKPQAVTEVMPVWENAELAILITESGRLRLLRTSEWKKSPSGISVRFDGGSNVTDVKLNH